MASAQNHLITQLPRADRSRLLACCQSQALLVGHPLAQAGQKAAEAYFPVSCVVSLGVAVDQHAGLEVAMVGREGMLGLQAMLALGVHPVSASVTAAGLAWRIAAPDFRGLWLDSAALRQVMARHVQTLMAQLAVSSGCLCFHQIAPRLARWLLMAQDRAQGDHLQVTHELLSRLLGVRRVGITVAAGALQRQGLVDYHRGALHILDRVGLEGAACTCYVTDLRHFRQGLA